MDNLNNILSGFSFDYGWRKKEKLVFDAYLVSDEITSVQVDAYLEFNSIFEIQMDKVLDKVTEYYNIYVGKGVNKEDLINKMDALQIIVLDEKCRTIGVTLECIWDVEHGIGIKFENEILIEIGYQDIVI